MKTKVDYQVLAPDSVAWHIQAALVADRTGNIAARDLALDEAKRIASSKRLDETLITDIQADGSMIGVRLTTETVRQLRKLTAFAEANMRRDEAAEAEDYDCRTTGERLAQFEQFAVAVNHNTASQVVEIERLKQRVDALERAATPAISNRTWMVEIEQRILDLAIPSLRAEVNMLDKQISSLHEHQVLDARRVDALESKLAQTQERLMDLERDYAKAELALRKRVDAHEAELESIGHIFAEHGQQIDLLRQQVDIRDRIPLTVRTDLVGAVKILWEQMSGLVTGEQITASAMASVELSLANLASRVAYLERHAQGITGPDAGL